MLDRFAPSAVSLAAAAGLSEPNATYGYGNGSGGGGGGGQAEVSAELRWWPLFLGSFVFCTLFGNALVVSSVIKFKYLRSVTNYFVVSLAVADITVGALVMPLAVYVEVMEGKFMLPDELCDGWIAVDVMACTASILNLVAISIDRFMAIAHPLRYQHSIKNSMSYTAATIAASWLLSIAIALPLALGANYTSHRVEFECVFANPLFIIFSSMGSFFIPSFVMIFLYWKIFRVIRERAAAAKEKSRERKRALGSGSGGGGGNDGAAAVTAVTIASNGVCDHDDRSDSASGDGGCGGGKRLSAAASSSAAVVDADADESVGSEEVWVRQSSSKSTNRVLPDDSRTPQAQPLLSSRPPKGSGAANGGRCNGSAAGGGRSGAVHGAAASRTRPPAAGAAASPAAAPPAPAAAAAAAGAAATRGLSKKGSSDSRRKDKKERKATITLVVVLGVFLFCWFPFFVLNNVTAVCLELGGDASVCSIPPWLVSFFVWLGYCNSTVNPLIYALLNNDFRRAFFRLLRVGGSKATGARQYRTKK